MKARTRLYALWVTMAPTLLFFGCAGYQVGTQKPSRYAEIQTIHVPTFQNETLEPRLAVITTNAVITALQQDGTYKLTNRAQADAVLQGTIKRTRRIQQRSANNNVLQTTELLEQIEVDWHLLDPVTGERFVEANPFGIDVNQRDAVTGRRSSPTRVVGQTTVFLDPNFQLSERQALVLAAEDAAEQIVSFMTDGW